MSYLNWSDLEANKDKLVQVRAFPGVIELDTIPESHEMPGPYRLVVVVKNPWGYAALLCGAQDFVRVKYAWDNDDSRPTWFFQVPESIVMSFSTFGNSTAVYLTG